MLAACAFGLEAVVTRELSDLGVQAKPSGTGRVLVVCPNRADALNVIAEMNLRLRAADRVLIRLAEFPVGGGDEGFQALYEAALETPWEEWIHPDASIPVSGRSVRSTITSVPALQRTVKRAIVERLRKAFKRPLGVNLPESGPPVEVEVSLLNDRASFTLDTSGTGLHKRGYRAGLVGEAALKETLAAGLVMLSVWRPGRALIDPFCGSGTIAIEAAMWARKIAPGLRRTFAIEQWWKPTAEAGGGLAPPPLLDPDVFAATRERARSEIIAERLDPVIHASDVDEQALRLARAAAKQAGVDQDIHFHLRPFAELVSKLDHGVVITNPPYGVRLEAHDQAGLEDLYRSMPAVFRGLPTWSFHLFTGRRDLETVFGRQADRRRKLYNSTIECTYFQFLGPKPGQAGTKTQRRDEGGGGHVDEVMGGEGGGVMKGVGAGDAGGARTVVGAAFVGLLDRDRRFAEDFARCLGKNLRHLRRYPSRGIHCFRIYERDVSDVPLIIDRYHDHIHAVEYERPHERSPAQQHEWFELLKAKIAEVAQVPLAHVHLKQKHRQRGLTQHEKLGEEGVVLSVQEGDPPLTLEVNLTDYVDTGLFLDHRLTRQMVREQAAGRRVLNLFCYTGSFSVYAAAGGAASVTSVDLSNTYLSWLERNLRHNQLLDGRQRIVREDTLEFLRAHARGPQYDLVIADPPTFSNSARTEEDWEVATDYAELLALIGGVLAPGGVVYFSNNYRRFKLDEAAVSAAGLSAREISKQTVPPEYRNDRIHRCWRMIKNG